MHDDVVRAEAMIARVSWPAPRVAQPDDVPALVAVTNLAYRVEEFFIIGSRTTEAEARERMSREASWFLVVDHPEDPGRIAGSVYMDINGDRGHFAMLAVDPAYQGTGLARILIEAVEDTCRAAGCRWLDLDVVNLRAELPAFYAHFGFTATGETEPLHDQEKLKIPAHVVKMGKVIS